MRCISYRHYSEALARNLGLDSITHEPIESGRPLLIPVFGLKAQGHIPTIQRMLTEGKTWEEIGREIGWDPGTAEKFYMRECPPNVEVHRAGEGKP
jgi:hypothetical protein